MARESRSRPKPNENAGRRFEKPGRTKGADGHTLPQRAGWNYEFREYATRIPAGIATNPRKLNEHLDRLHPRRAHFHARVVEYR